MNTPTEIMILSGEGYNLTIDPAAEERKRELLEASSAITSVTSNDESADAAFHVRSLAGVRIAVEKAKKEIKEPVIRIGKLIEETAKNYLSDISAEETRIKKLIADHAEKVAAEKAELERKEREAFEAARAAREAAETQGGVAAIIAAKQTLQSRMQASEQVATTKVADGVRFAWDFEVVSPLMLVNTMTQLVDITPRRADILQWLRTMEDEPNADPVAIAAEVGIKAFKKPVISTR